VACQAFVAEGWIKLRKAGDFAAFCGESMSPVRAIARWQDNRGEQEKTIADKGE
jgi:hypothetical protein